LDGKQLSAKICESVKTQAAALAEKGIIPCLAVILVGDDSASLSYVKSKEKALAEAGMKSLDIRLAFPNALNIIMGHGIRGMGDTKWMMYTQIIGTVFVITLSYILVFIANTGLIGIFITFLADETIRGLINRVVR